MTSPPHQDQHRAQHRAAGGPSGTDTAQRADAPELEGKGPGGMWWVAWRQHRLQIAVTLGVMLAIAAAMVIFREVLIARFAADSCSLTDRGSRCVQPDGSDLWWSGFSHWSDVFHLVMTGAPVVLGVFAAAPIFPREFAHGTQVFALIQSVGRLRWWAVKTVVVGAPVLAGLVALGIVMQWVDATHWATANQAMGTGSFAVRGIMPATYGLVAVAIGTAAGIIGRSVMGALIAGLILAGVVVIALNVGVRPNVLPASRAVTPIDGQSLGVPLPFNDDPNAMILRSGYLDAQGQEIDVKMQACYQAASEAANQAVAEERGAGSDPRYQETYERARLDCVHDKGAVSRFADYLPGRMLWPLRWAMTGICAALAALFLAAGAWRLRTAVSKR